jgi:hypothetical protein
MITQQNRSAIFNVVMTSPLIFITKGILLNQHHAYVYACFFRCVTMGTLLKHGVIGSSSDKDLCIQLCDAM